MDLEIFILTYGIYPLVLFMNAFKLCVDVIEMFDKLLSWLAVAHAVFNKELGT